MFDDDASPRPRDRKEAKRPGKQVSLAYLQRVAMHYLESFSTSSENLRKVLRRKVEKRCRERGEDPSEFYELVDEVVATTLRVGLVDDTRYAEARVATMRRRGGSTRAIQAKLAAKGVDRETIDAAIKGDDEDADPKEDELTAARAFAKRKKLGPYRTGEREPYRQKDLATLARAGFSFDVAREVVGAESTDWDETFL